MIFNRGNYGGTVETRVDAAAGIVVLQAAEDRVELDAGVFFYLKMALRGKTDLVDRHPMTSVDDRHALAVADAHSRLDRDVGRQQVEKLGQLCGGQRQGECHRVVWVSALERCGNHQGTLLTVTVSTLDLEVNAAAETNARRQADF